MLLEREIKKPVCRGYFEGVENNRLYIEHKDDNTYIAKRGNVTYTEYCLSDKDIDFIINGLSFIWNDKAGSQILRKHSRGKYIELIKEKTMSLIINDVTMIKGLNKEECRKLYAMFAELKKYGLTNKLI